MRIVGGSLRGRRLAKPQDQLIRPTTDRTRESLFNILAHLDVLQGAQVLDAFAGTGALGIEALSRGAGGATFLDTSSASLALVRENLTTLHVEGTVKRGSATNPARWQGVPHTLAFLDPPYGKGLGGKAALALAHNNWLVPGALLVLEEKRGHLPDSLPGFEKRDERAFGETAIAFFTLLNSM